MEIVTASKADLPSTKDLCKLLLDILKNLDTQSMISSSEQDNLDLLLDEETNNNCLNTQCGTVKDVPGAPLPHVQPVTAGILTNLNLCQLQALLQNSIHKHSNIDPLGAALPDSGQNKNTVDSTGENSKGNGDNNEEESELLQDLMQEFECQEERGPPFIKN